MIHAKARIKPGFFMHSYIIGVYNRHGGLKQL